MTAHAADCACRPCRVERGLTERARRKALVDRQAVERELARMPASTEEQKRRIAQIRDASLNRPGAA